ncbi:hypothetical protein MMC24_002450 [Lignoscripta atroalba]|nr:hypothetical protein [Lignoscripta atroalba]
MFQCVGLATEQEGGCGEDWWHPECLLGLSRDWYKSSKGMQTEHSSNNSPDHHAELSSEEDHPSPPGFPHEDEFEALICYKCTEANPWIKRYAGSEGFLSPLYHKPGVHGANEATTKEKLTQVELSIVPAGTYTSNQDTVPVSKKRKAEEDEAKAGSDSPKKPKVESDDRNSPNGMPSIIRDHDCLPPPPHGLISLLKHPQLLEEEETYEPPLSDDGDNPEAPASVGTGSLLDRGEAALSNVDRVRAIEGVMVYNHLKEKVKSFLQPFAESGQVVGAEDIKAYFEKLRGDAEAIKAAGGAAEAAGDDTNGEGDNRREQHGY